MHNFKHCPDCGARQAQNKARDPFVCDECEFMFFHNSAAAVAGIIFAEGKTLFTVRAKAPGEGKLDFPGGFVDRNEDLESALTREVMEELGIHVKHWRYLCSGVNDYPYKGVTYQTCDAIYFASLDSIPSINKQESEIRDFLWLEPHEINTSDIAFPSLRLAIAKFLSRLAEGKRPKIL